MDNCYSNLRRLLAATFLTVVFLLQVSVCAFAEEPPRFQLRDADPLQQMNRMKDLMEKQLLEESLQKDLVEYDKKAVDDDEVEKARKSKGSDLKFDIKEVRFTESTTLTKEELNEISKRYVGLKVTLDQLYEMVNEVNELYRKKGYAVCRAFLPEQTIKDGIAKVTLVEGKTGKIKLDNIRFTRKNFIISRTGLKPGKVNNLKELNRRISLFNAVNDVQLAVKLAAGEEQGTTDYVLTLDEPERHTVYALSDNVGSESTGRVRYGLGWTISSPLGIRDTLSFSYMRTIDSDSGGASYSFPVTKFGTKLSASVYGNTMQPTTSFPQEYGYHGDSTSYSLGLTQPFCVTQQFRAIFDFSWSEQFSDTKLRGIGQSMQNNRTNKYSAGIAFTHFGRGVVWYHRYSFTRATNFRSTWGSESNRILYWIYNLNFVRQQAFMNGHSFTVKLNGQYSPTAKTADDVYSSDYFYIGGVGSVRGYNESLIGGEHGFNVSLEYAMPFRKYRNLTPIVFVDYGRVYGPGSKILGSDSDTQLASTGLGLRWTNKDGKLNGTIWLGIPLIREANNTKIDIARIHFSLYGQFENLLAYLFNSKDKD